MRNLGTLFACLALLTVGCDDSRTGDDGGGIVLMDAGSGSDSGPATRDSGSSGPTFPTSCSVTGFMPLPSSCTPRCTSATLSTANACADVTCFQSALMSDPTPAATLSGPGGSSDLDCFGCFAWQVQTCWAESCPTEFDAWGMCSAMMGATCTSQEMALDACLMANSDALNACATPRINQCFAGTTGFLPDFGPRIDFQFDLDRYLDFVERYDHSIF